MAPRTQVKVMSGLVDCREVGFKGESQKELLDQRRGCEETYPSIPLSPPSPDATSGSSLRRGPYRAATQSGPR